MNPKRQAPSTEDFLRAHPVFTLEEFAAALGPNATRAARDRLKYHAGQGRVKLLERGLYASVPAGIDAERHRVDRFLVAAALRPEGILSHHAALELLGAAHSVWSVCTVLSDRRRRPLDLVNAEVRFLEYPAPLRKNRQQRLGSRHVDHHGTRLDVTGPERTLVDGFHRPRWAGGLAELVESASGFGVLDLELLTAVLDAYGLKTLCAAVGWFLDRFRETFFVPDQFLRDLRGRRPRSPIYLPSNARGGTLVPEWNLVLPDNVLRLSAPDAG